MGLSGVFSSKHREQNYPEATQRKITIAIINQRFSIGINEDLLNLYSKSGNQKSEIRQYKSKPSSLEIALKLRKMPSLKLNYSSSAFSRALLHNKKVGTRYFGDETS